MSRENFNSEASLPRYSYRKNPVHPRGFMIVKTDGDIDRPRENVVGDYTVLDLAEDPVLSEKKVMNIISLLNGRRSLVHLGHETGLRILYHVVTPKDDDNKARVLFYQLGKEGVSVENALFRIEKDENDASE